MPGYGLTAQTTRQHEKESRRERGEKTLVKGCNVTGRGTKQLSAFCHVKPHRNTYDRNCRPRHHGGLSFVWDTFFFLAIGSLHKREIFPPNYFSICSRLVTAFFHPALLIACASLNSKSILYFCLEMFTCIPAAKFRTNDSVQSNPNKPRTQCQIILSWLLCNYAISTHNIIW